MRDKPEGIKARKKAKKEDAETSVKPVEAPRHIPVMAKKEDTETSVTAVEAPEETSTEPAEDVDDAIEK